MTTYPDKYSSNITNSTSNRGVEAKETEIANTRLEGAGGAGDDAESARSASSAPPDCPSYLQVVVEKHHRGRTRAASSPAPAPAPAATCPPAGCMGCGCGAGDAAGGAGAVGGVAAESWPLARPAPPALARYLGADVVRMETMDTGDTCALRQQPAEAEAECVEVYRFLRVGAALGAGGAARRAAAWRRSARARRAARAAAAELGAAARLAAGAPLGAAVLALRWALQLARDAVAGAVHAASDYALKPALALLFNALLHPLLVFVAHVLQGSREAARPACAALGECAAHAATVLGALRLAGAPLPPAPAPAPAPPPPACRCVRAPAP